MGLILNLITDRSQADVDCFLSLRAKINLAGWSALTDNEKASWMSTKGEYRYSDLNRVGSAIQYLAGLLTANGYPITVNTRTNWTVTDSLTSTALIAYLADISRIKSKFYGRTPLPSTMDYISYSDANNIELLLLEIEKYISSMLGLFRVNGRCTCGSDYFAQFVRRG